MAVALECDYERRNNLQVDGRGRPRVIKIEPVTGAELIEKQMTPELSRAARGLVDWTQAQLAEKAGVGVSTIKNFEAGRSMPLPSNFATIRAVFESAGVEFIPENGGGAGVRLRKKRDERRARQGQG